MCFSAEASFVAGFGLVGVGIVAVKRVRTRQETLYASIPLLFGVQQLLEGFLWLTFTNQAEQLSMPLAYLYLLFSNVLWPIYIPLSVLALETVRWRRLAIVGIASISAVLSIYLLTVLVLQPVTACIDSLHILYDFPNPYELTTKMLYVLATCASLLFSRYHSVVAFGVVALISEVVANHFYTTWFISVWCFFAALLSAIVLWYFKGRRLT